MEMNAVILHYFSWMHLLVSNTERLIISSLRRKQILSIPLMIILNQYLQNSKEKKLSGNTLTLIYEYKANELLTNSSRMGQGQNKEEEIYFYECHFEFFRCHHHPCLLTGIWKENSLCLAPYSVTVPPSVLSPSLFLSLAPPSLFFLQIPSP